ncbi:hypothetical protein H9L39_18790 [Fusarium oxysporum f. sp. albedinis]|nr:hypothetical protein H9L39_18790 [Fusarium oxysporum f. sp. albedinis]
MTSGIKGDPESLIIYSLMEFEKIGAQLAVLTPEGFNEAAKGLVISAGGRVDGPRETLRKTDA